MSKFSPELREAIRAARAWGDEAIDGTYDEYMANYERYTKTIGAPLPEQLTVRDLNAVLNVENINALNGETWSAFVERVNAREVTHTNLRDAWMPIWNPKTPDRLPPWLGDCGQTIQSELPDQFKMQVTKTLQACIPFRNGDTPYTLIGEPVISDVQTVKNIATRFADLKIVSVDAMGESLEHPEFRWSKMLALFGGLGFDFLRTIAASLVEVDDAWHSWLVMSNDELRDEVVKARELSGYPLTLLRADFCTLRRHTKVLKDDVFPVWLKYVFILHILKHVRFIPDEGGKPALHVAYKGSRAVISLLPGGATQSLLDSANAPVMSALSRHLQLDFDSDASTPIQYMMRNVLSKLHPCSFVEAQSPAKRIDILVSSGVSFGTEFTLRSDFRWIDPGIEVRDIAVLDMTTGIINKSAVLTGPDVLNIHWPFKTITRNERASWLSTVPDKVEAKLPSEVIKSRILNVNTLGCDDGFWTMVDGLLLADLIRDDIVGSVVGQALQTEFPLVFVFPIGSELETTTNQGKTTLAKVLANILVPSLAPDQSQRSTSAPAQRTSSMNLAQYGTAIFDEFVLPTSHDHMLSQSSLQSFATGVGGGPGRAGENASAIRLKHPLFFTAKLCDFPPDIVNRMFPCFLDAITPQNGLSGEQLTELVRGAVAPYARLSTLLWIHKADFITHVRAISSLVQGVTRFTCHASVMSLIIDDVQKVKSYFKAAELQCVEQLRGAENSGLAENIGATVSFDPVWYFNQLSPQSLEMLFAQFKEEETAPLDAVRIIVEDGQRRVFNSVLNASRCREATAVRAFKKAITDGRMHTEGYVMQLETKKGTRGRPTGVVRLVKETGN